MLRKERKLSQEQLANLANISRNYVSMIERGEANNVSDEIIRRIAVSLGVSLEELTGYPGDSSAIVIPPSLRDFAIREKVSYKIVDKLQQIPFRGQEPQTADEWQKLYNAIKQFITTD